MKSLAAAAAVMNSSSPCEITRTELEKAAQCSDLFSWALGFGGFRVAGGGAGGFSNDTEILSKGVQLALKPRVNVT